MAIQVGKYLLKSGDKIYCKIKNYTITDARIHFGQTRGGDTQAWICHNEENCSGESSPVKYEYRYSWALRISPRGELSDNVSSIVPFLPEGVEIKTPLICPDLTHFLKLNQFDNLFPLFYCKVGLFDEFEKYEISETDGCIKLSNDRKSTEVKLSRFVKQISLKLNEFITSKGVIVPGCNILEISDKTIESLHNAFVAFQKNGKCSIVFYKGEDILKGYLKENYALPEAGTLHKSCMVNQLNFLNLYTKNPNQVQLASVSVDDKIVARGLVWTATDGKMYSDRIYYQKDWLDKFISDKLRMMGIYPIVEQGIKTVQLEKWEFEKYPYVDSFFYFDKINGTLLAIGNNVRQLRNTNGNG